MSVANFCLEVPEILLNAPSELKDIDIWTRFHDCIAIAIIKTYRIGCIVLARGGKGASISYFLFISSFLRHITSKNQGH